jgi:hypothetical protein
MTRLPFILSGLALAAVAGCATTDSITSAHAPKGTALEPAVPTYSVGAAGTTIVVPQASAGATAAATPAAAPVAAASPALRAGLGRIEAIEIPTDASGAIAKKKPIKRITMRMNDGTLQYFNTKARVTVGDRIEVTSNGAMRHPV